VVDAEVVDGDEDEVDVAQQALQTFGGIDSYRTLAPAPQPHNWGGNQWQGVGNISDQGNLPNVVVSNNTGQTTYTDASTLLAK
jgi:hypothetical protein